MEGDLLGHMSNRNSRLPSCAMPLVSGEKSGMGMDLASHESMVKSGRAVTLGSEDGRASEGETLQDFTALEVQQPKCGASNSS